MSFFSKIVENKGAVIAATSALVLFGGVALLYKQYLEESQESQEGQKHEKLSQKVQIRKHETASSLSHQIEALKHEINVQNPSLEDIKKILLVTSRYSNDKIIEISNSMKISRRIRYPKENRKKSFLEYAEFCIAGVLEMQETIMQLQKEQAQSMQVIGINPQSTMKYQGQLMKYLNQMANSFVPQISLAQAREGLQLKIDYLEGNGSELIQNLIKIAARLTPQQKSVVSDCLNCMISDEALENRPDLDHEMLEIIYNKEAVKLQTELVRYEKALAPLIGQLQMTYMGNDEIGEMRGNQGYLGAEMGNMNMGNMNMGNMDHQGLMEQMMMNGQGGIDPQVLRQQMQMLSQMQAQDPVMYKEFMAMAQAQAGAMMGRMMPR